MFRHLHLRLVALALLVPVLACSTSSVSLEPGRELQVLVKSQGQQLPNPNTQLVHRYSLSPTQLDRAAGVFASCNSPQRAFVPERDRQNNLMGLRVTRSGAASFVDLGVQEGDIVTALNKTGLPNPCDFSRWLSELQRAGSGSATLLRLGAPHKLFFIIERKASGL